MRLEPDFWLTPGRLYCRLPPPPDESAHNPICPNCGCKAWLTTDRLPHPDVLKDFPVVHFSCFICKTGFDWHMELQKIALRKEILDDTDGYLG